MNLSERLRVLGAHPPSESAATTRPIEPAVRMPLPGASDVRDAISSEPRLPVKAPEPLSAHETETPTADLLPNPFMTIGQQPVRKPHGQLVSLATHADSSPPGAQAEPAQEPQAPPNAA